MPDIHVDLGDASYPIYIGSGTLSDITAYLQDFEDCFIVSDQTVSSLYLDRLGNVAIKATYICDDGENSKSIEAYNAVMDHFLSKGITRKSVIIALGGGVVGDLAGFVAATILRGVAFIQIPTTLLAQVDSSVGGKTGLNVKHGKNLIGAFYQPKAVLIDVDVLKTLPDRQLRAGYAEVLKYALINDSVFFDWLCKNGHEVLARDKRALEYVIEHSCTAKASVVAQDERETGQRALLNLGHTFGHALEKEAGYDGRLLHGEGVVMGMHMAMALSVYLGVCPKSDLQELEAHYAALHLRPDYKIKSTADDLIDAMRGDKKNLKNQIVYILMRGIGKSYIAKDIAEADVKEFLELYLN